MALISRHITLQQKSSKMSVIPAGRLGKLLGRLATIRQDIRKEVTAFEATLVMTLVLLFRFAGGEWFIEGPITILVILGLLYRSLVYESNYWFTIVAFLIAGNYYNWYAIDNHKYLFMYWSIAIYCSLYASNPRLNLASNAQWMIALVFLFATIWKVISPDFLNSTFFVYEFLTDGRFQNAALVLAKLDPATFYQNGRAIGDLMGHNSTLTQVQLAGTDSVLWLAQIFTVWTIIIEGLLALLFLLPTTKLTYRGRSLLLLIFLVSTYSNAPVIGFGWVLAVMGFAQAKAGDRPIQFSFVAAFFLIWIYGMPWSDMSYGLFNVRLPLAR